jgi:thioredoxin-like negative regulator of GroEL
MAQEAFLLARKLYDEREIKYSNLAMCVRRFDEAEWYLETVEPKPDYYAEIIQRRNDARRDLDERYNDQKFRAERAIKLRDWQEASAALQAICELVPDRADPRNEEARKQLLDVQRRMDVR